MIRELWSSEDESSAELLREAADSEALGDALFAIEGADAVMRAETHRWLMRWSERVVEIMAQKWYGNPQRALARVLVEEMSFRGDDQPAERPENSYLSGVVRRRRGLPILLSSVWAIVGRSAGIDVKGIGLPGHFVIRVDGVLVDPYAGGRPITISDCQDIVSRLSCGRLEWQEHWLDPVDVSRISERVLRNLIACHLRRGDAVQIYRALRLLTSLDPDRLEFRLQRARLAEELGSIGEARTLFSELAEQEHCAHTACLARECLCALQAREPLVN